MSDALNAQKSVTDAILKNGADYLLSIRKNSNKKLVIHIEAIFNRELKKCVKDHSVQKNHGRIDEQFFEILPAAPFLDKRIKDQHSKVRTLVKYTKVSVKITDGIEGK